MKTPRALLGHFSVLIVSLAAAGCSSSTGGDLTSSDSGRDVVTCGAARSDGFCCCDGDVVSAPICSSGKFTCEGASTLMTASDCAAKCTYPPSRDSGVTPGDSSGDVSDSIADGAACGDAKSEGICCCDGDVLSAPICSSTGTFTCQAGYTLYSGGDCITKCSYRPPHDTGVDSAIDAPDAPHDGG